MNCVGQNPERSITFSVPIEKEVTRIDKNWEEITKAISYRLQFIDSARVMARSLSNLVDNLVEGIHKIKWANYNMYCVVLNTQTLQMIW